MSGSDRPDHTGPVPAFVTIGVAIPVLIAATILVDRTNWSIMPSAVVLSGLVAVCCISGRAGVAAFVGVVTWFVLDGFVQDTGGTLHAHSFDLAPFAVCVALPTLVALTGGLLRWTRQRGAQAQRGGARTG